MTGVKICALWKMAIDPSTRSTYFYNIESGEVQWVPLIAAVSADLLVE